MVFVEIFSNNQKWLTLVKTQSSKIGKNLYVMYIKSSFQMMADYSLDFRAGVKIILFPWR